MNILLLSTHFNAGGIASYLLTLGHGLTEKGHKVFVVTSGGDKVSALTSLGVPHKALNIRTKSELSLKIYLALNELCRFVKDNKIEIIHAQTRVTQVMASLLSMITNRPYVTTCHGFFRPRVFRQLYPCWGEGVIAISEPVKDHLMKDFGVEERRITLIPHGINDVEYVPLSEELKKIRRQKLNLKNGSVIGIIARLSDVKGHSVLIKAMPHVIRNYPDTSLLIAGQGKMERELRALVKELNLEDHVRF